MTYLTAYLVGTVAMFALFAWRNPREDARLVFQISIMWPLSIFAVLVIAALMMFDIDVRTVETDKKFGYRKPGNPEVRGFGLTLFGIEYQVIKRRKVVAK